MKKDFIIIVMLVLFTNVFAMGFRDTYWGMPVEVLQQDKNIYLEREEELQNITVKEYQENSMILKQLTQISYIFLSDRLSAIGYSVPYSEEIIKELLPNLTEKYGEPDTLIRFDLYEGIDETQREEIKKHFEEMKISDAFLGFNDIQSCYNGGDSVMGYILNNKDKSLKENSISFVRYISHSNNIYVFVNSIALDKIVVIYTEHEDDF